MYSRGRRGAPAKGVGRVTGARVQISPSPPAKKDTARCPFLLAKMVGLAEISELRRIALILHRLYAKFKQNAKHFRFEFLNLSISAK